MRKQNWGCHDEMPAVSRVRRMTGHWESDSRKTTHGCWAAAMLYFGISGSSLVLPPATRTW
jgi:hypothetical protein